jgi:hypothetical protein
MVVGKVVAHLCLALLIILKFSVEHDRVVTTLNLTKHPRSYFVYLININYGTFF